MTKTPSIFGGILLVIGNVVGAGILALPIATAQLGLPLAIIMLLFFWALMILGAYYFLEANMALPPRSNLVSMSRASLGRPGVVVAWICNLLVMYSLIAAYISGGGDLIKINFKYLNFSIPSYLATLVFTIVFGLIVSRGIHRTDHTNRILMIGKMLIFFVIIFSLTHYFSTNKITWFPQKNLSVSLLIIVLTSFGFAPLIPSLRIYYQNDLKKLKQIIFLGTFIPLVCYVIWVTLVFSVLPYHGPSGLEEMSNSPHPVSDLQTALSSSLHLSWLTQAMNVFSAICIITSFLANSISLTDFLADGLNLYKNQQKHIIVYFLTFLPPLCAVLFYPKAFLLGLSIAGILAIIQLLLLPGLIVWFFRYNKISPAQYNVWGGKLLLTILLVISLSLLLLSFKTL